MLLGEDTQHEAALAVRLKGGRDDDVFAGRELEAVAHLTEVGEGVAHGHRALP